MISVWTYQDTLPRFARLDYWTGIPLMLFGNLLFALAASGYEYLLIPASGTMILGGLFLFLIKSSTYLLETYDENGVIDTELIDGSSWIFSRIGIYTHQVLSGPYSDYELTQLSHDLGVTY